MNIIGNIFGEVCKTLFPIPVHKTPFYNKKIKLPSTDWAASHVLSLPIHPLVSPKNLSFIAKTVRESLTR